MMICSINPGENVKNCLAVRKLASTQQDHVTDNDGTPNIVILVFSSICVNVHECTNQPNKCCAWFRSLEYDLMFMSYDFRRDTGCAPYKIRPCKNAMFL